ncbi:MAG: class I SAM-dependent methyltransferase [Bacteroidota bacterium]
MSDIIKKQLEAYQPNFLKHGSSPEGTFQNNSTTQFERFNQLLLPLLNAKPDGFTICDIGSGIADLHRYLTDNGIKHQYTGVEIVPEMVEVSKEKYPEARFLNVDLLDENFTEQFDFVVLSGTFNIPGSVSKKEWEQFILDVIKKMFSISRIGISFNTLTSYSTFNADELFYQDPSKILHFIQAELSRFCIINTAYPLYEVSYSVFKKEFLKNKYPHPDFAKYFKG